MLAVAQVKTQRKRERIGAVAPSEQRKKGFPWLFRVYIGEKLGPSYVGRIS